MEILNDDIAIWQSFKSGDKDSYKTIYFKYYNNLYEYGVRITADKELVKDTIHDLFIKLWNNKANLGDVMAIMPYLLVSLRSALYNSMQKVSRKSLVEITENSPFEMVFSVESEYIKKETASVQNQKLIDALNLLTPRQKEVIYLRYFEELDYDEIAVIMEITVKAVYKLTARGLETLRQIGNISDTLLSALFALSSCKLF
ncbi:MAG TPA: sigma-70 family RNA polymerase sigma factor [Hanamia sp.]|nr:sigma-70 family RNA polymerase sigma factor [Hanamia sp.]